MAPQKRSALVAVVLLVLRGVAYALSFALAFIGTLGGGKGDSHYLIADPTIGISTAHADAPPLPGGSSDCASGGGGCNSDSGCSGCCASGSAGGCGSK